MQTIKFIAVPVVVFTLWFALAAATLSAFVSLEQTKEASAARPSMLVRR
jgi:hypothetical protein